MSTTHIRASARHIIRRTGLLMAALCLSGAALAQGSLSGSVDSSTTSVNLTTQGTSDWAHWGTGGVPGLVRKSGGGSLISTYSVVGSGGISTYSNDLRAMSWSGGTPTASASADASGLYISNIGNGFSITVPADTTQRVVKVYVGGWNSTGSFTASLSDASATNYTNTTTASTTQYDRAYTLTYKAASAGKLLTLTWVQSAGTGNVTLNGAALAAASNTAPTLAAVANQSGVIGQAVSLALSGSDADGNTLSYSATGLPAGTSIATATGLISGTPTTAATYNVTAQVSDGQGGTASRSFTWTIAAVTATTTALTSSVNPSTSGQNSTLVATVSPAAAAGTVTFKDGSTTLGTGTLSSGVATLATSFTATGAHSLTAVYAGNASYATSTSSAVAQTVTAAGVLPPAPIASAPIVNYEYDAQGNPTKTIQAPGVSGFGFESKASYDALYRVKDTTDPKLGKTQLQYDGGDRTTQVTDPRNLVTQYPRDGLGQATQLISPDTGTASHTYDAAGNLKTRTDSRGVLATNTYDVLNRLTNTVYSKTGMTTQTYGWTYDETGAGYANGVGRLTSTTHPSGSTQYTYDAQGRLLTDIQRVSAATGANSAQISTTVTYGYDAAGHTTSIVYPSGRKLVVSYTDGQPTAMSLAKDSTSTPVNLITGLAFEPFGGVSTWQWQLNSGTQSNDKAYDTSGRLIRYRLGNTVRDLSYDAADRITGYTHYDALSAAAQTSLNQNFGYDANGQLTSVTTASASWTLNYDANGNRTSATLNGVTSTYTPETTSNRLTSITNPARSFGYDSAGNTTSDTGGYTATYDASGRLATITKASVTTTYSYNGLGQRVRKFSSTGAASTTLFVYDQDGQLLGEYNSAGTPLREYVWLGSTPIAVFQPNGSNNPLVYYLHTDHLGTPRLVTDTANNIRWRWLAEPFGTTAPEDNPSSLGVFTQNLRFPGQFADSESGLFYNYFRNYDSSTGRYTTSDPIGLDGGINTYAYVSNNPLSGIDPQGLFEYTCLGCHHGAPAPILSRPVDSKPVNPANTTPKPEQCPQCDATASRTEATIAAYSWAGIPIGGAGTNPIPWNNFNMPSGMSRSGREYGEFMRTYYPKNYGYSTPGGALVVEHPFGHPDQPGPAHHACPHFHAKNAAGVEQIFTYKPGS
jgi:RHS repeat-associated protein